MDTTRPSNGVVVEASRLCLGVYRDGGGYARTFRDVWTGTDLATTHPIEGRVYVVVRGTEPTSLADLWTDIRAWPALGYHSGFLRSSLSVGAFFRSKWPRHPTVWCGHSLGGAVAAILAERYGRAGDTLVTFGAPKYRTRFRARPKEWLTYRRICNRLDPVPFLPMILYGHTSPAEWVGAGAMPTPLRMARAHAMSRYRNLVTAGAVE